MPDAQALYYTLSTIAQTLAGALAVLVAIVLFKLSALARAIETAKATMISFSIDPARYWPVMRDHGFEDMANLVFEETHQGFQQNSYLRRDCEVGRTAYWEWGKVKERLYTALGFTVADVALCFVALPFVPSIIASPFQTWIVWTLAVALGIACLILYVWLIAAMVQLPDDPPTIKPAP